MTGLQIVWLWLVTGDGQWRGVTDTFGQAQLEAETCMENGGKVAVVESARCGLNSMTMEREYVRTGRRWTASRTSEGVSWTPPGITADMNGSANKALRTAVREPVY